MASEGSGLSRLAKDINSTAKSHVKVQTYWATATAIDWSAKTMTATAVIDELPFYDVQLGVGSFFRKPKNGTMCLIGIIENKDGAAFLIDAEELDESAHLVNGSEISIDGSGFTIKRGSDSLKDVVNDLQDQVSNLCDEVSKIVVLIGTSPNVAAIASIAQAIAANKTKFNSIFTA